ncbi:MAG: DUF2752 domain-containing protein [Planctomycetaceae bacterium]
MSAPESLPVLVADDSSAAKSEARSVGHRSRHVSMFWIAVAILVLSFALRVRADQRVALIGLGGLPAPELCGSRKWFGIECPGCGLTRGFIRLASGDWSGAIALNRVAPLLGFAVLTQIPYRLSILLGWPPARRFAESSWPNACGWVLTIALIGNWGLKMFGV